MWAWAKNLFSMGAKAVGGWWSGLAAKLGLVLGYVSIGVAIVLGCAAVWFYNRNVELSTKVTDLVGTSAGLRHDVDTLQGYNEEQDRAISDLVNQRVKDGLLVQGLLNDYKGLSSENASTKAKIRELERKSDEVKAYLSSPLPASVRSVLNGEDGHEAAKPAASGHQGGKGKPAPAPSH